MKLKRICALLAFFAAVVMGISVWQSWNTLGRGEAETKTILRMAVPYPDGHPSVQTAEFFAGLVEEKTGGRIQISVYPDAELGNEESTIEQLTFGGIAFSTVCTLALPDESVKIQKNGSGGTLVPDEEKLDSQMLELLAVYHPDYRCIANNQVPMKRDHEGAGLNIQAYASNVLSERLKAMGITVVQPGGSSPESSLNNGYIDGMELAFMEYSLRGYTDILPYFYIYDGPLAPDVVLASQVSMGNLSGEDQNMIRDCALQAVEYQREALKTSQEQALETLGLDHFTYGEERK